MDTTNTDHIICGDCGRTDRPIHADSLDQRGEPICVDCVRGGAFDD
jgi:hypothetical protein